MSDAGGVIAQLARPSTTDDRRRARLVTGGVAGAAGLLLAAFAIVMVGGDSDVDPFDANGQSMDPLPASIRTVAGLAPYVAQSGLRGGTVGGALLLTVPFVAFAVLALRTGTAARERRLAALSLAGASRRQLRGLALREGTRAAVLGALLGGPVYLLLWLLFGRALPYGWRMLPDPTWWVLAAWGAVLVLLTLGGAVAAVLASDVARVSPLGVTRRVQRPLTTRDAVTPVAALLLVFGAFVAMLSSSGHDYLIIVVLAAAVVLSLTAGRWLVLGVARAAARQGLISTLAGRRLLADVRTPGRAAGVLFAAGAAIGFSAGLSASLSGNGYAAEDLIFYLSGAGAAAVGATLAAAVACGALVIAAAEQVLDGRRGIATLVAMAASPEFVQRVIHRQLLLAGVPPMLVGAALGLLGMAGVESATAGVLVAFPLAAAVGWIGATLAARAIRPTVLACSTSDNLRAP